MGRKTTRHSSLTQNGAKVAKILTKEGFFPHPGEISARAGGGGEIRIKIIADDGRTRIRVSGGGVQQIYIYGSVSLPELVETLSNAFGSGAIESVVAKRD